MSHDTINANEHMHDRETAHSLALKLYVPIYAERTTIKEAYAYAREIAQASDNPAGVMTAIHVVLNTVAKEIEKLEVKGA